MTKSDKKDKYLQPCLERRCSFTLMVYSKNRISGIEAVLAQQHSSLLLSNNMKREYLEMCGFVRAWVSLAVVRSNTPLLLGDTHTHTPRCSGGVASGAPRDGGVGVLSL